MKRLLQFLAMLGVNAVPALGWFVEGWSPGTTLVIYWFENIAACLFVSSRIWLHQRWVPSHGHFKYKARKGAKRGPEGSFLGGFMMISLVFSAAHGFFLGVMLMVSMLNGHGPLGGIDWRSVGIGSANVMLFLAIDFLADLPGLRKKSFLWIEQMADRNLARVIIVHLSIIFGIMGVVLTNATKAFFGVFIGLKTLNDLSTTLPQWDPAVPPVWLCRFMDKIPNAHPGETFAEFWVKDKADELARRGGNEKPYPAD